MIDKNKQYRTRDGRDVRIYATDGGGEYPVHAAIKNPDGWKGLQYLEDGTWCEYETPADLIEVKPRIKREVWVNVYPQSQTIWISEEAANVCCTDKRIACVKLTIDCEEGEGL